MATNSCFKQTGPRPDDWVELPAPPCSPLTEPERDDAESAGTLSAGTAAGGNNIPADEAPSSHTLSSDSGSSRTLSDDDDDDVEIVARPFELPEMIPESADNLCTLPTHPTLATTEVIRARKGRGMVHEIFGQEVVRRKVHLLSDPVKQTPRAHRVGVDLPWMPDALTANTVWKAHTVHARHWERDSVKNPVAAPPPRTQDPGDESAGLVSLPADHLSEVVAPVREILRQHVKQPFPVGPAPGEEYIIPDAPPPPSTAHLQRPSRPVGAFDPAERVYYIHQRRLEYLRRLMRQGRSEAEAIATVEHTIGGGVEWKTLCDEAETAEYVLRVDGKLPPLPEWAADADRAEGGDGDGDDAPAPPKPKGRGRKKSAPKPKGKGKGKAPAPAEGEAGPSCAPARRDAEAHGPSSCAALPADAEQAQSTKRGRRECRPSQKAKEIAEALADLVPDEGEAARAAKRQRR